MAAQPNISMHGEDPSENRAARDARMARDPGILMARARELACVEGPTYAIPFINKLIVNNGPLSDNRVALTFLAEMMLDLGWNQQGRAFMKPLMKEGGPLAHYRPAHQIRQKLSVQECTQE